MRSRVCCSKMTTSLTVSLILDTVPDGKGYTEVVVLPYHEAAAYLSGRNFGR